MTNRSISVALAAMIALMLAVDSHAQREGQGEGPRRNQGGGVNNAPSPGVFTVVSVDSYGQTVNVRAADGSTANVDVGSDIYDLSKLRPGSKIQINFLQPDGLSNKLSAANVWPVR